MKTLETMRNRRSVRSFDGKALSQEDAGRILEFAAKADNPYGIPIEWKLLDSKKDGLSSPVIVGTDTFIAGKMQQVPHAEEAFGYSFEKTVLYAWSLGVGTTWIAGTMDRQAFEKAMEVEEGEVMPCISPLGYAAKKMSLRETLMRKAIKADTRLEQGEIFFDGSFDKPLAKEGCAVPGTMLEAVRLAPSAVNKQPWRMVVCGNKVHFYEKYAKNYVSDDGWDIRKIDLGIALCHFAMEAEECGTDVSFEIIDPGIPAPEDFRYIASFEINTKKEMI